MWKLKTSFSSMVCVTAGLTLLPALTAPCPPPGSIQRLISIDSLVYARAIIPAADTPTLDSYSQDGGQTWQYLSHVPDNIAQDFEQEIILPKVVCDPANIQLCYRIAGQGQVEESIDGGGNWRVTWSLPEERRSYMERVGYCHRPIELGPYDLALANQAGMRTLVVAIGSEGVLVRTPAGEWERYTVVPGYAIGPTPYAAENLWAAVSATLAETGIWMLIGFFTLLYLWRRSRNTMFQRMADIVHQPRQAWLAAGICILTAIAIFPLAWLPFLLWAFGTISHYELALVLSMLLTALSLWWGIRRVSRASHMATTPPIDSPSA